MGKFKSFLFRSRFLFYGLFCGSITNYLWLPVAQLSVGLSVILSIATLLLLITAAFYLDYRFISKKQIKGSENNR